MTNIPPPPLDVRRYHVDSFRVVAHDEYDSERSSGGAFDVGIDVQQEADDHRSFKIDMTVSVAPQGYTADENPPYSLHLDIVGYFTFLPGTSDDVMIRMVHLNGSSMLYGIARGFVGQATGAARHGQFLLPAVNFIALLKQRAELDAADHAEDTQRALPNIGTSQV